MTQADLFTADKIMAELCARIDQMAATAHSEIADITRQAMERVNRSVGQQKRRMAERMGA